MAAKVETTSVVDSAEVTTVVATTPPLLQVPGAGGGGGAGEGGGGLGGEARLSTRPEDREAVGRVLQQRRHWVSRGLLGELGNTHRAAPEGGQNCPSLGVIECQTISIYNFYTCLSNCCHKGIREAISHIFGSLVAGL